MSLSPPKHLLCFVLISAIAKAEPVIEESFAYEEGAVSGLDGGLGFGGAWSNPRNNPAVITPGLTWGDLLVSGNSSRGNAWSSLVRPLGSSLSDAGLLDDGATLWFSVIFDLEGQNIANADLSISLGTAGFFPGVFGDRENLISGEGIGATHSRAVIQGVYWQDTDADTIAERVENSSTTVINGTGGNLTRALVVGRIDWGSDETAGETLTLYAPGEDLVLGDPTMAAWAVPALNQSAFNQLALQYKDTPQFDEIRFGATAADVLPTASGPPVEPAIAAISPVGSGIYEITITGSANTEYLITSSDVLDFANSIRIGGFTQESLENPGTIGGNDDLITTDENGTAIVRVDFGTTAKNFIRMELPISIAQ